MQRMAYEEGSARGRVGAVNPDNMVSKMTNSEQEWNAIIAYITGVMKENEVDERRRQANQQS